MLHGQKKFVCLHGNVWKLRESHKLFREYVPGSVGVDVSARFAELRETRTTLESWAMEHNHEWK